MAEKPNSNLPIHNFESMSGANTSVIFEFMHPSRPSDSIFVKVDSIITIAYSVYRSKSPVYVIGENAVSGFGLGNRNVAGSIIKTLTYADEMSKALSFYQGESLKIKNKLSIPNLGTKINISIKDFESLMRDDTPPFNIYTYSFSEYTGKALTDAIYGVTIVNTGQVLSIESLLTENTISFIARSVKQANEVGSISTSIPSLGQVMTGSKYLKEFKR